MNPGTAEIFFFRYRLQSTLLLLLLLVTLFAKCNLLALEVSARTEPLEAGVFSNTIKKKRLTLHCARLLRQVVTWSHQRLLSKNRATFNSKSEIKCVKFDFHRRVGGDGLLNNAQRGTRQYIQNGKWLENVVAMFSTERDEAITAVDTLFVGREIEWVYKQMVFELQLDLSPVVSNSTSSRFLSN